MSRKGIIGLAGLLLGACALGAAAFWQYGVWAEEQARQREQDLRVGAGVRPEPI